MKKTIIILLVVITGIQLQAQETKTKKEIRAEKKAQETAKRDALRVEQENWVQEKTYVLEAQQVFSKAGEVFQLNSSTSFVYLNNENAALQLSFDGLMGWNGVGGITVKGKITKYEYQLDNKNKPIFVRMTIQGPSGFQDVTIWISNNGSGEAQITDLKGNRIRFTGDIVPLEQSRIFMGIESF